MFSNRTLLWKIYFIVGCVTLGLYALRPPALLETGLVFAYGFSATVATFWVIWQIRPRPLAAWVLLGIGQTCITIGDLIFAQSVYLGLDIISIDLRVWFYVFALNCFLAGSFVLTWTFRRLVTRDALINGLVVVVGLGVVIWLFHIAPSLSIPLSIMQWVDRIALPILLITILAQVAVLLMTPLGTYWSWRFLVLAICFYIVGISFYNEIVVQAESGFASLGAIIYLNDAFFSATYLLLGMTILHPSIKNFNAPILAQKDVITRFERIVLGACSLIIPVIFTSLHLMGRTVDVLFTVVSMGVTSLLVIWRFNRMADTLESQNRQLKRQKDRLSYQAHTDALTTLPNRFYLYQYLTQVVERACRSGQQGAVLMIDLNRFKEVNDTFGHDAGDRTLREIANLFVRQKRKSDVVARWGGDEFIYILEDVENEDNVLTFARRLHNEVYYQVEMHGQAVTISLSIGICLFPMGGSDVHTIVKHSDIALYQAKKTSGEKIYLYTN